MKEAIQKVVDRQDLTEEEAKREQFRQSVAHYTSQTKLWALRGCESTIKTVGRGNYLHTLLNDYKKQISGGKSLFHI